MSSLSDATKGLKKGKSKIERAFSAGVEASPESKYLKKGENPIKPNLSGKEYEGPTSKYEKKKPNKKPTTPDEDVSILDTYKSIRKILNDEILTRQKNPKYLVDKYGVSEVEQLRKIAQFALRLVEQKNRDDNDFDTNGTMKNANVVSIEKVEFKVKDHKNLELTRVSKVS